MVARLLGRLILVPLGFVLAAIATLAVVATLGLERVTRLLHGRDVDVDGIVGIASYAYSLAAVTTVVPALIVVLVGEVARIRSTLYYVVGGGLALLALPMLVGFGHLEHDLGQSSSIWQVSATAGFAGGMVYWLVAGRCA